MKATKSAGQSRRNKILMGAAGALAGAVYGMAGLSGQASAAVFDVALSNNSFTTTNTGLAANQGIVPITAAAYPGGTPVQVSIPDAPSATYDAADKNDTGTMWNVLESVGTAPTANSGTSAVNVLYEQSIPLKDSLGNVSTITATISEILPATKADFIHTTGSASTTAGTDGLLPNPSGVNDGIGAGTAHNVLMGSSWVTNSSAEGIIFTLSGLVPNAPFSLYVYGAGSGVGQGGTFTLAAANGGAVAATNTGAATLFKSVFSTNTGNDPGPEQGLSWNLLTGTADSTGSLTVTETTSESTGAIKPAMNGFQLQTVVPEPASLSVLGLSGLGLLARRRTR